MAKHFSREDKLVDNTKHQAICTKCNFAGTFRDTVREAEDDADSHTSKPGNENHIVRVVTIKTVGKRFSSRNK